MTGLVLDANLSLSGNKSLSDDDGEAVRSVLRQMNFILFPIISLVGFCGNTFSVVVIWKTSLKKISSNHYLVALALSDSVFLVALFMMWISKFGVPSYHASGSCQSVLFMLNCSSWLSSWYIMALTIERFYVVHRPLSKRTVCTISRTKKTIVCLIPWPALFNIWVMFGGGVTEYGCNILEDYQHLGLILNCVDTLLSFVLPVIIIVACNISICVKLCNVQENMFNDLSNNESHVEMRKHAGKTSMAKVQKVQNQERKITKSLVMISFIFVAMNLPSYAMRLRLYFLAVTNGADRLSNVGTVLQELFFLLYYANFSINFFVYSLSSDNFRKAVKIMWLSKILKLPGYENFSRTLTFASSIKSDGTTIRRKDCNSIIESSVQL